MIQQQLKGELYVHQVFLELGNIETISCSLMVFYSKTFWYTPYRANGLLGLNNGSTAQIILFPNFTSL